jgi:hypothetical protein
MCKHLTSKQHPASLANILKKKTSKHNRIKITKLKKKSKVTDFSANQ